MLRHSGISKWGYLAVLITSVFGLYQLMVQATPAYMTQELISELGLSRAHIGVVGSALLYSYILLQIPAGRWVDNYGPRRLVLVTCTILALGCLFFGLSESMTGLLIGRILMGVGSSGTIVSAFCLAHHWFPKRYFAFLVGLIEMSAMIGGCVGSLVLPELISEFGWRYTMYIAFSAGLVLLMFVLLFLLGLVLACYGLSFVLPAKVVLPCREGVMLAMINCSLLLAGPVFQPLLGWLLDLSDVVPGLQEYRQAFLPVLGLILAAFVAVTFLKGDVSCNKGLG